MQAFQGAITNIDAVANDWVDAGKTYRAVLVKEINEAPQPDWQVYNDFFANNVPVTGGATPAITGRTANVYDAALNAATFNFAGALAMGNPAGGQNVTGVLIYEDTGNPATSPIWFYDDNVNTFPLPTLGGDYTYGSAGTNECGRLSDLVNGVGSFAGAVRDINEGAGVWNNAATNFALRLVTDGGVIVPNPDWLHMSDLATAGVQFASGASDVAIPGTDRLPVAWEAVGANLNQYQYRVDPASIFTFPGVPSGQTIAAVVMFRNTGNDATSRVWHWDGAFTPVAANNGNITYGNGLAQVIEYVQL